MDVVLRSIVVFGFLMLIFRISGRRTLAQVTNFDFVLLLTIGEATQQALLGDDFSLTNAMLIIVTLTTLNIGLSLWQRKSPKADQFFEGTAMIVVEDGKLLHDRIYKARIDEGEILKAARELQGLERIEQIKYAVLEREGSISIVPY